MDFIAQGIHHFSNPVFAHRAISRVHHFIHFNPRVFIQVVITLCATFVSIPVLSASASAPFSIHFDTACIPYCVPGSSEARPNHSEAGAFKAFHIAVVIPAVISVKSFHFVVEIVLLKSSISFCSGGFQ